MTDWKIGDKCYAVPSTGDLTGETLGLYQEGEIIYTAKIDMIDHDDPRPYHMVSTSPHEDYFYCHPFEMFKTRKEAQAFLKDWENQKQIFYAAAVIKQFEREAQ